MIDMSWLLQLPAAKQQAYFQGPALKPPPGVVPDFAHPPNQNVMGYAVLIVCATVVAILVTLQLYSRVIYHKKFAIEDGVTIAAVAAYATFLYYVWSMLLDTGVFVHQWNIRLQDLPHVLYIVSAGSTTYGVVIMLLKAGILIQWAKIFVPTGIHDYFWWTCHITLWINVLFYTVCTFVQIFGCSPRERLWTPWIQGKCLNISTTIIASAFVNFFSDMVILLMPQMVIWKLNMSTGRKFGTAALFLAGLFATVCAGLRIKSCFVFSHSSDTSYNMSALGFWCVGEMTAGFLVLCLPALPKLFKTSPWIQKFITALRSISGSSSAAQSNGQGKISNVNHSWPRSKPRRAADASLFTDTHMSGHSFVQLHDLNSSNSEVQEHEPWLHAKAKR